MPPSPPPLSPRTAPFERYPRTEQAGVPFPEIILSRLCAHVLYCSVSRAHLSDSGARQSAKDAGRLSWSPSASSCLARLFLGGHTAHSFSRMRIRGHGSWAGAQNHGSTCECPDAHRPIRIRSSVHEPLRKSLLDGYMSSSPSLSLYLSTFPRRFTKLDICHRKTIIPNDGSVINWPYHKKWYWFANKLRETRLNAEY